MSTELHATGEIQVIPLGVGVSVRSEVKRAHRIIEESGLTVTLHANGTNVEGDIGLILKTIETIHHTLHAEGTVRLVSYVKIATRTDKTPTLAGKMF